MRRAENGQKEVESLVLDENEDKPRAMKSVMLPVLTGFEKREEKNEDAKYKLEGPVNNL